MKSMAQMRLDLWNTNSVAMRSVWICVRNLRHGKKHGTVTEILSYFRDLFDIHSRNIGNTLEHHADPLRIPNQARWRHGFLNAICGSSSAATNATNEPLIYHIYTYTGVHMCPSPTYTIYLWKNGCAITCLEDWNLTRSDIQSHIYRMLNEGAVTAHSHASFKTLAKLKLHLSCSKIKYMLELSPKLVTALQICSNSVPVSNIACIHTWNRFKCPCYSKRMQMACAYAVNM